MLLEHKLYRARVAQLGQRRQIQSFHRELDFINKYIVNVRELPSQVKGAGFRVQSCRSSCVRIAPLAPNFFVIPILVF